MTKRKRHALWQTTARKVGGILQGDDVAGYSIFRTGEGGFTQRLNETVPIGGRDRLAGILCYTMVHMTDDVRFRLLPTVTPAFWRRSSPTVFGEDDLFSTQFSLYTKDDRILEFFADERVKQTLIAAGKVSVELRPHGRAYALVVGRPMQPRRAEELMELFALLDHMLADLGHAGLIEDHAILQ